MRFELSFDDGHLLDLKVLGLLLEHELAPYATFYIPTIANLTNDDIRHIAEHCEIGGHTVNHPQDLKKVNEDSLAEEIEGNKQDLERIIKSDITSFCYPRGRFNHLVKQAVIDAGFKEARTARVLTTDMPKDLFEKDTTVHVAERNEYNGTDWLDMAKSLFQHAQDKEDGYFHLWGHSWEIEENDEWDEFEKILDYFKERL